MPEKVAALMQKLDKCIRIARDKIKDLCIALHGDIDKVTNTLISIGQTATEQSLANESGTRLICASKKSEIGEWKNYLSIQMITFLN